MAEIAVFSQRDYLNRFFAQNAEASIRFSTERLSAFA